MKEKVEHKNGFTVTDRRFWKREEEDSTPSSRLPTYLEQQEEKIKYLEKAAEQWRNRLKEEKIRQQEELKKFRQRVEKNAKEETEREKFKILEPFLSLADELSRTIEAIEKGADSNSIAEAVKMIDKQLTSALKSVGIEKISPTTDHEFTPHEHEAVEMENTDSDELDGKVARTVKYGYKVGDRLLRPAKVVVFKKSSQ